jgi:hypothetical protein
MYGKILHEGKKPLGKSKDKWKDTNEMDLKGTQALRDNWIHCSEDRVHYQAS